MVQKKDMCDYYSKGPYPRLQFVNKFFLHAGISHHYDENKVSRGMEDVENQLMTTFDCDPQWPVCLFDFTYKNRIPTFFAFKVLKPLTELLIDDYATPEYQKDLFKKRL